MLMSRLFFAAPGKVKLVLVALALLPCAPGATFLLAGWARDPGASAAAGYERAREQSHELYRAGSTALGAGLLCGLVVVWTVVRRRDADEDEDKADD